MLVKLAAIFFSMILVNNYVLVKFYGICPFLGVSKKLDSSIGMSGAVIFVMLVATAVTFPIQIFVLNPADLGYLQTIVFILVIAVLVQFIEIFLKKYVVALYNSLGVYLPLITTNCAILGIALINVESNYNFLQSVANSIGTSLGYTMAILLFSCIREKLNEDMIPSCLRNLPIALITAACMSIAMMGMSGIH